MKKSRAFNGQFALEQDPLDAAIDVSEQHVVGADTRQWILRAPDSAALQAAQIEHVGINDAAVPYSMVRTQLSGSFLLATLAGEGRMLLDGRWRPHRPGMVSLAPALSLHAFHAIPGVRWQNCWVRFSTQATVSRSTAIVPLIVEADGRALECAIRGLQHEVASSAHPASEVLWVELIQHYVARFASHGHGDPRIFIAFEAVQRDYARPWAVEDLARKAHLSPEHLRRLCLRFLGRSPMQQVTALRVQRAAHLLATTDLKIEVIASEVGYQNPFAFSNTFKKLTGLRPSAVRASQGEKSEKGEKGEKGVKPRDAE